MTDNIVVHSNKNKSEDNCMTQNEIIYTRTNNQIITTTNESEQNVTNIHKKKCPYVKIILFSILFILIVITICILIVFLKKKKNIEVSEDYSFEEAKDLIGSSNVEDNYKLIEESLSDITESINILENSNKRLNFDPIIYDSSSLIIPEVLKNSMDEKSKMVEEDIQMYNNKYGELSEKINEFTDKASQSIKEMPSSLNNLKDEIKKLSEEFEVAIKETSYPLVLEQQTSKNKKISGRKLIKSEEIEDYKL